jgi:hypothetical protein
MRRLTTVLIAAVLIALAHATAAGAQSQGQATTGAAAEEIFLGLPNVARWLERYPPESLETKADFDSASRRWEVGVFSGKAGQIAKGEVDRFGNVHDAWVGPQVAWPLARGDGIGGAINRPLLWLSFCLFFLFGLANYRRPLSMHNADLLALLSFSIPVAFVNEGRVFASAISASVSLAYLIVRCAWIGLTNRSSPAAAPVVPVWLLLAGLVFIGGARVALNTEASGVLDVGYAGVIGADRIASGTTPYGNFPRNTLLPCGELIDRTNASAWIQDDGRCESANQLGDTYGPINYHAYLPGLWLFGWSGRWDSLPSVHFTTLLFDALAMLGLAAVGFRFGGTRLAVTLAFAWVAYPFTQYVSSSNTNDTIMPALLIWGFWAASSPAGRGAFSALAAWTKFAALIVAPLWLTYPARERRPTIAFAAAFGVVTALSFWVVLLSGDPVHELRVFYDRTFRIQAERNSPFSLWDWGDYHAAGIPDLRWAQRILQVLLVIGAVAVTFVPRGKTLLQLAAFTAALLVAFELTLTHWFSLYVVWFFPFVLLTTLVGSELRHRDDMSESDGYALAGVEPGSREPRYPADEAAWDRSAHRTAACLPHPLRAP